MVEAAGIAPASSDREREPSTCVAPHRTIHPDPPAERARQDSAAFVSPARQRHHASQPARARPSGPQANRTTASPNRLGDGLECLRSENGLRFCYRVVVGTWCCVRCFTRPPDHLGMPLAAHWSESILVAPHHGVRPERSLRRRRWISRSVSRSRIRSRFSKSRLPFPTANSTFTRPCC